MRIAIVEDEAIQAEEMGNLVRAWAMRRKAPAQLHFFDCSEQFLLVWPEKSFDLVLLDIQMRNLDGFQLAELIRKTDNDVSIVFMTHIDDYIHRGYDVGALHYLRKPPDKDKLFDVLDRAHAIWSAQTQQFILVPHPNGVEEQPLPLIDVFFLSQHARYTKLHTISDTYQIRNTMKALEQTLPSFFVRCNRDLIVNIFCIRSFSDTIIMLKNDAQIGMSQARRKIIADCFWGTR